MFRTISSRHLEIFIFFVILLLLSASYLPAFSEGSASFNSGNRERTITVGFGTEGPVSTDPTSTDMSIFHNAWTGILPTSEYRYIYTFAKAGETINLGTNFTEKDIDVTVIRPNGQAENYDVTPSSPGFIRNYLQERNGPNTICTASDCSNYYTPIKITASETGLYKVAFYSAEWGSMYEGIFYTHVTDELFSRAGQIAAFDITVTNGTSKTDGRSFTYDFTLNTSLGSAGAYSENFYFYVLADDGIIYSVTIPLFEGGSFPILANQRGIVDVVNDTSLHHSIDVFTDRNLYSIRNTGKDSFYRLFYNNPDNDLLEYLGLDKIITPVITDFSFAGNNGDKITSCEGGVFSFMSDKSIGSYEITINTPDEKKTTLSNSIQSGKNTIEWDGRDSSGECINNNGEDTVIPAVLNIYSGENHIVFLRHRRKPRWSFHVSNKY